MCLEYIQISDWDKHCILVNGRPYIKLARVGRGGSSKVYKVREIWIFIVDDRICNVILGSKPGW